MNNSEKISKATNVKSIDQIYRQISEELSGIDMLRYIKIYNGRIKASSAMSTNGKLEPIVQEGAENIVGVDLLIYVQSKTIQFYLIMSSVKGYGEKMVSSVANIAPKEWSLVVLMDWSGGFWQVMAERYPRLLVL